MGNCYMAPADTREYAKEACECLMKTDFALLERIGDVIADTKRTGKRIFTAGNGGSAATASHMANDLTKGCRVGEREGFKVHCLNDPNAIVTCLANDFCYADIYKIMLRSQAQPGDVLIVFSGSGNSPNIVNACATAKEMGLTVIGFGGRDGGKMKPLCDLCLIAPTESMEELEDLHMVYNHALVCYLKKKLATTWDVETVHYPAPGGAFRYAIFDFDGTVSLLREGWQPIMYQYFTEELLKCPNAPASEEAKALVMDFVDTLTGKQTIFQCIRLGEEVARFGGTPEEPVAVERPRPVTANRRAFRVLVRNALISRVRLASLGRVADLGEMDADWGFGERAWQAALDEYFAQHDEIVLDADARSKKYLVIDESDEEAAHVWHARQIFRDESDDRDFSISADVDLDATQMGDGVVFANYRVGFIDEQ